MERTESLLRIMEATASFQHNVALILEAKAHEAEKSRNWVCDHTTPHSYPDHDSQFSMPLEMHEQLIEVIDALTKLEVGFAKNIKIILSQDEDDSSFGMGGGMFNTGGGLT